MENQIKIYDKTFVPFISATEIENEVKRLSEEISDDFSSSDLVFLIVLNGAFMFASDLLKQCEPHCDISFIKLSSYQGTQSSGKVLFESQLTVDIKDKNVIVVEDIVDTGLTIEALNNELSKLSPKSIKVCSLLFKPNSFKGAIIPHYVGFSIPNKFVLGYGMDYNQKGRNLKDLYQVKE
tara:strand:+ start:347 stop:886 length:540 start_codon:yes stop_codon:yes gene_type:complete